MRLPDLSLLDLVIRLEIEARNLVLKELMDALLDGLHRLAGAGNPHVPLGPFDQQVLGNRPGLDATAATIQDLVTVRLREEQGPGVAWGRSRAVAPRSRTGTTCNQRLAVILYLCVTR